MALWTQLHLRRRLSAALLIGAAASALWPGSLAWQSRLLVGWNAFLWLYLPLVVWMMLGPRGATQVQQRARALADGMPVVLLLAVLGALASLAAITLELQQARQSHDVSAVLVALATVVGSWLLLPVEFGIAYASVYHREGRGAHGLEFPGDDGEPTYADFLYFSITIAATSQTSDVTVSTKPMRRLVLLQSLLAFVFNTGVLALSINILAGLIS